MRAALSELAERERQREIGEQIAEGYRRIPQTTEEAGAISSPAFPGLPDDDWGDWL